jgi:hypothetical protein
MMEYQEEHAVRRGAMERILKRQLRFGYTQGLGLQLLHEYVAGGYLPNNALPESAADPVDLIIKKYLYLADHWDAGSSFSSTVARQWLLSFAATEIHALFFPGLAGELMVDAFHATAHERLRCLAPVPDPERDSQTYIACRRTLLRSTDDETAYALWLKYLPDWSSVRGPEAAARLAADAGHILPVIVQQLAKPLAWRVAAKLKNYGIYFSLLRELLEQQGTKAAATLASPASLEAYVRQGLEARYIVERKQIRKRGRRAVTYIFFTKIILAVALEFPYDYFFLDAVDYTALAVNVAFHPLLLLAMTMGIGKLGKRNTDAATAGVLKAAYDPGNLPILVVNNKPGRGLWYGLFTVLYIGLFTFIFGGIINVLRSLNFHGASITLFIFFLALVSYFGLRIRFMAKRWKVEGPDEGIAAALWGLITLPIVRAGRWMSGRFASINVFIFLMDFVIEAPFKMVLRGMDAFLGFLREKREETY